MSKSDSEMLDWLCWKFATDGERFYPPDETAEECIQEIEVDDEHSKGWEHGQHTRAWTEAVEVFEQLETRGFDPVARAERHIQEQDLPQIDWEWWEATQ